MLNEKELNYLLNMLYSLSQSARLIETEHSLHSNLSESIMFLFLFIKNTVKN